MYTADEILNYYIQKKKNKGWGRSGFWSNRFEAPQLTMELWYEEARKVYNLCCTYEDFSYLINNEITTLYHKYHSYKARRKKERPLNAGERFPASCRKPYKKKILSEEIKRKREWRNKVKDHRDQGRCHYDERGWTILQRDSNKVERRKVKHKIKSNIWETYPKSSSYWEVYRICNGECCDEVPNMWIYNYPENDWDSWSHPRKREALNPYDYY